MKNKQVSNADIAEQIRLEILKSYEILDTSPERVLDNITRIAAEICDTPISLISLVDETRQWFKSRYGIDVQETPREIAFCNEAIKGQQVLEIPDALEDLRFKDNPLVTSEPKIRFYAGAPLITSSGHSLGTLCVVDQKPNSLTQRQKHALEALARGVVLQFELTQALRQSELTHIALRREVEAKEKSELSKTLAEKFLLESLNAIVDHVVLLDATANIVFVNQAWKDYARLAVTGTSPVFELGANYLAICEKSAANGNLVSKKFLENIRMALHDDEFFVFEFEYPIITLDEENWFVASISSFEVHDQRFVVITHHNITRRKKAEIAVRNLANSLEERVYERTLALQDANLKLAQSEEKYRTIFENSSVGFSLADELGEIEDANMAFCNMLGREKEEIIGKKISSIVHDDEENSLGALSKTILEGKRLGFVKDVRLIHADGRYIWGRASVAAIYNEAGKPVQTLNLIQDFTEQKTLEEERNQFFENSVDMLLMLNNRGDILEINPAFCRVFGYSDLYFKGKNVTEFTHPDDVEKVDFALQRIEDNLESLPVLEVRMQIRIGEYRYIRWSASRTEKKRVIFAIGRDVTKSLNYERALHRFASGLQEIREEERSRISREIHDELGQILTALKIDLNLLGKDVYSKSPAELGQNIKSIVNLVNTTLESVKRIAQDLRPEILDLLGLVPALESHAKEVQARTGIDCEVLCNTEIPALDTKQTTQLFRIVQEALTNVIRHANATYARVLLEIVDDACLKITIQDNGRGFNVIETESQSLGLLGMQERARSIQAAIDFTSGFNKGTIVAVSLSLDDK